MKIIKEEKKVALSKTKNNKNVNKDPGCRKSATPTKEQKPSTNKINNIENKEYNSLIKFQPYNNQKLNKELLLKLNIKVNSNTLQCLQRRNYRICYDFKQAKSNEIAKRDLEKFEIENKQIRKIKFITMKDYDSLNPYERIEYDKRSFFRLFWDIAISEHPLLNLIFFKSLMDPLWLRFILFVFEFKVGLALSALFFSDDYIDARSEVPQKVRVKKINYLIY